MTKIPVMELPDQDRSESRRPMRLAFMDALYVLMDQKHIAQRQISADLGWGTHTRFTKWRHGMSEPHPDEVFALEDYLGVKPGVLSKHLGYLPPAAAGKTTADFENIVKNDDMIPAWGKEILLTAHREIIRSLGRGRRR